MWVDGDATTATTSNTITSNDATWVSWNASATTSATASAISTTDNSTVWISWNGSVNAKARAYQYQPRPETEEEKQARLVREEQARVEAEERRRKEAEALQRAEDLLMLQLSVRQREDWQKHKAFDVISESGKRFRIRNSRSMNVDEYDETGKKVAGHCIVPSGVNVPAPDQFVMQMLMLQHHEADFMRIANHQRYTH